MALERQKSTAVKLRNAISAKYSGRLPLTLTPAQVGRHSTRDDCYLIVHGQVYDATPYMDLHPGGADFLMRNAGGDATADFEAGFHSKIARMMLDALCIGKVAKSGGSMLTPMAATSLGNRLNSRAGPGPMQAPNIPPLLDIVRWREFTVTATARLTHDTVLLTVFVPASHAMLPMLPGQHVFVALDRGPQAISRPYTPVDNGKGAFRLAVKAYPDGGLSPRLCALQEGDKILVRGPSGKYRSGSTGSLVILAAGTGITALLEISEAAARDARNVVTVYSVKSPADVLFRQRLVGDVHIVHTETDGVISKVQLASWLPPPGPDVEVLMCGPPAFNDAIATLVRQLGYTLGPEAIFA